MSTGRRPAATARGTARRRKLTDAAGALFARDGYHNVTVWDIAAAAGVSGPAIYRHFAGKPAILAELMRAGFDEIDAIRTAALAELASAQPAERLEAAVRALAAWVVRHPEFGVLWRREFRHLAPADAAEMAERMSAGPVEMIGELRRARPELTADDARLVAWAALSVLGSVSDHRIRPPRPELERLTAAMAVDVLRVALPAPGRPAAAAGAHGETDAGGHGEADAGAHGEAAAGAHGEADAGAHGEADGGGPAPSSRREMLIAQAVRLFWEFGYHGVTMEDIGAACGIAGPSVYKHFDGKADVLRAAVRRLSERLLGTVDGLSPVPAEPERAAGRVALLVERYVAAVVADRGLVATFQAEAHNLPDRDRAEARRMVGTYARHWEEAVAAALPDRTGAEIRMRIYATFAVINDSVRTRSLAEQADVAAKLQAAALAALDVNRT
ncbi:TetR/AcrR family transcriptional regulator [Actinacidiphila sp. bgisy145]|uniref:TetR/AcrR family transcriptional regulator n=1 Tax=Actinacidiphila sp. bgisy145 TaxID=3413792 RepID=UPI003EBA21CA